MGSASTYLTKIEFGFSLNRSFPMLCKVISFSAWAELNQLQLQRGKCAFNYRAGLLASAQSRVPLIEPSPSQPPGGPCAGSALGFCSLKCTIPIATLTTVVPSTTPEGLRAWGWLSWIRKRSRTEGHIGESISQSDLSSRWLELSFLLYRAPIKDTCRYLWCLYSLKKKKKSFYGRVLCVQ